jgi:hypothetical protein
VLPLPAQVRFESVHPGVCLRDSVHSTASSNGSASRRTRPPLRLAPAHDQARALEHLEIARDGRAAHPERLRQLAHGRLALGEAVRIERRVESASGAKARLSRSVDM